jgi:hypothetical protein
MLLTFVRCLVRIPTGISTTVTEILVRFLKLSLNLATTVSFHILSNLLFNIAQFDNIESEVETASLNKLKAKQVASRSLA